MADLSTERTPATDLSVWDRGGRIVVRLAILYLVCRLATFAFFILAATLAEEGSRFGAAPAVSDMLLGWDAQWYWFLAVHGYPAELPLTDAGQVAENQWAFMPVYAYLAGALAPLFGGSWGAAAVIISLLSGFGATYVLYRILRPRIGPSAAYWGAGFFAAGPLSALFVLGYAEALFLLWLFLALWAVTTRRYVWVYPLVILMGYTRPGVLAFALFLGLFGIWRFFSRRTEPLRTPEIIHIVALGALATVVGFSWQVIAAVVTGDPGAYLATELAWRRNWLINDEGVFVPFDAFVQGAAFWGQTWGWGSVGGVIVLVVVLVGIAAALLWAPQVRALGPEIRLWAVSYLVYLLAVFFPQSSIFRLLVPLSPLWGAFAVPRSLAWRAGVLVVCLAGQWWWIYNMYALGNRFWQIP
ncbi:hypothetical protein [Microbacterium schleiferi]|uniref:hypothetical protein n=1 Tax=Microbacterium schleiferi TaxID=69362 RepID=UPI001E5CD325|nr:hypothetical protein [Microbacterium schleiferi]